MRSSISSLITSSWHLVTWRRVAAVVAVWVLLGFVSGCDGPQMAETDQFEAAEQHYRAGNYEEALDGYQAFLRHYPRSPLANVAEQRIRTINREVSSMLGRSDTPRPIYKKTASEQSGEVGAGSVEPAEPKPGAEANE